MQKLIHRIQNLRIGNVNVKIKKKLASFSKFEDKDTKEWFSELCFCILTSNSKARSALKIQQELGADGFNSKSQEELCECILRNKHRFHNNKSKYIINAREYLDSESLDIKDTINFIKSRHDEVEVRDWIVENIKGLGLKEASHFLRNVGFCNFAILDRHVLNLLVENNIIKSKPANLSRKLYLEIEKKMSKICIKLNMAQAELDFYLWYLKTGEVLK